MTEKPCTNCGGTGLAHDLELDEDVECPECDGTGYVTKETDDW